MTYLFMPTHQTWSYLFVTFSKSCMRARTTRATSVNVCVGIGGHPPGPVSIDRARPSWRRLQVQTTNASKCIQASQTITPEGCNQCRAFRQHSCRVAIIAMAYRNCDTCDVCCCCCCHRRMLCSGSAHSAEAAQSALRTAHFLLL